MSTAPRIWSNGALAAIALAVTIALLAGCKGACSTAAGHCDVTDGDTTMSELLTEEECAEWVAELEASTLDDWWYLWFPDPC